MKEFDIIIIGCGPAGIAAASALLKNNADFCMIEKEKFPRKKLCAGGLTNKSIKLLKEMDLKIDNIIKQKITNVEIDSKSRSRVIPTFNPVIMVDRSEFDNNNLTQIKVQNKNIYENEIISHIEENIIVTNRSKYRYKFIIFADGVNGYSRKITNLKGIGFSVEFDIQNRNDKNMVLSFDATKDGYAWIFPKGNYSTVGLVKFKNVKDDYNKLLLDFCKNKNIAVKDEKIGGFPIPGGYYIKPEVIDDNKIIVGDAAGLVDPITGEGIYYAMLSGKYAAEAIIEKLKNNKVSLANQYNKTIKKVHKDLSRKVLIGKLLNSPLRHILITIVFSKFFRKIKFDY